MADVQFGIRYANFWHGDGGGIIKGLLSAPEETATDGVISLDELTSWTLDWTGNDIVPSFTLSSEDGTASALIEPSGFLIGGGNTPFDSGSDADGLDQGLYEVGSGDQIIDLGALIVEDFAAGGFTQGTAADGLISVGELVDIDILYTGFDADGTIEGTLTVIDADAEDGLITLDELMGWEFAWTSNDDVAAFSISSEDGETMSLTSSANALLPDNGFSLTNQNTAVDAAFNDADGLDQGLYESGSGEQVIDLGALIVEDLEAGTFTVGDTDEVGIFVGPLVEFDLVYSGFWDGKATVTGSLTTTEAAAADGLIEVDELASWSLDWSGNENVAAFSISSEDGDATALLSPSGFLLDGSNTPVDADFNDADGTDQGVYESGDRVIDLGALIVEDVDAGTVTQGTAPGTINIARTSRDIDDPDSDSNGDALGDLDFDAGNLSAGTVVTDQFSGLTISADGFGAMLFDTANPAGDDTDLASDTLGNVLILSEDGNSDNPNDSAAGGTISFVWDSAVNIDSVGFLDAEESGHITVKLFGTDGSSLGTIAGSRITEDGGTGSLGIGVNDVSRMDVRLVASSAITDVTYV